MNQVFVGERSTGAADRGRVGIAISSSVLGNSTAFGFSIMITTSFATLIGIDGQPRTLEIVAFALAAALAVATWEGAVTRGFRERVEAVPAEVSMLGTAMNVISVAAGILAVLAIGELLTGLVVWPVAAFVAASAYVFTESVEILIAELIQRARGDPHADKPQD